MYDLRCLLCGQEAENVLVPVAAVVRCASCGGPTEHLWRARSAGINGDEIPGGQWQENGFHTPRLFYSKSERKRALAERGLEERVCHAGIHDTIVPRWVTMDAQTLKNAEILASRHGHAKAREAAAPDVPVMWTVREWPT